MQDAEIEIKKVVKYSPNGYDVVTLQPGRYKASELDPVVLKLHKKILPKATAHGKKIFTGFYSLI